MKYKSKLTGEIISAELLKEMHEISLVNNIIESTSNFFESIYEVGDWVYVLDNYKDGSSLIEGQVEKVTSIRNGNILCLGNDREYNEFDFHVRPATPGEIDKIQKLFPFIYESRQETTTNTVTECQTDQVVIEDNTGESIFLTKEAFQEIGKRKGWL